MDKLPLKIFNNMIKDEREAIHEYSKVIKMLHITERGHYLLIILEQEKQHLAYWLDERKRWYRY